MLNYPDNLDMSGIQIHMCMAPLSFSLSFSLPLFPSFSLCLSLSFCVLCFSADMLQCWCERLEPHVVPVMVQKSEPSKSQMKRASVKSNHRFISSFTDGQMDQALSKLQKPADLMQGGRATQWRSEVQHFKGCTDIPNIPQHGSIESLCVEVCQEAQMYTVFGWLLNRVQSHSIPCSYPQP